MSVLCEFRPFRLRFSTCLLPIFAAATGLRGQVDSTVVPLRYLVAYWNGAIPGDTEFRTALAGAEPLPRHDRFGIATVQTIQSHSSAIPRIANPLPDDDVATMQSLAARPNLEYVLRCQPSPRAADCGRAHVQCHGRSAEQPALRRLRPTRPRAGPCVRSAMTEHMFREALSGTVGPDHRQRGANSNPR